MINTFPCPIENQAMKAHGNGRIYPLILNLSTTRL